MPRGCGHLRGTGRRPRCLRKAARAGRSTGLRSTCKLELSDYDKCVTAFDALIIGTGQAGPALAARLSGAGMKVAVVEKDAFGGTCVNNGCTPTKAMVASAYAAHLARRAGEYGVLVQGEPRVD